MAKCRYCGENMKQRKAHVCEVSEDLDEEEAN
jgi:hypothetical protein